MALYAYRHVIANERTCYWLLHRLRRPHGVESPRCSSRRQRWMMEHGRPEYRCKHCGYHFSLLRELTCIAAGRRRQGGPWPQLWLPSGSRRARWPVNFRSASGSPGACWPSSVKRSRIIRYCTNCVVRSKLMKPISVVASRLGKDAEQLTKRSSSVFAPARDASAPW